ncbi:hypothetical protein ACIF85_20830 [Streptomyces sp. NPDC086033]|uniref:hypothetical protein n=1 Tax=Streptomyces sp. NPDC086033 TaxID=3365747 RepID=UPI0037CF2050
MSTEARRASIPPRPATPPRPAQPPTAGEDGPGSEPSEESRRREAAEPGEREIVEPGGRMSEDTDWQAFGERSRRGPGAQGRATFAGFDWQASGESGARVSGGPDTSGRHTPGDAGRQDAAATAPRAFGDMNGRRETDVPGGERSQASGATGRPPIRTTDDPGSGSTPPNGEAWSAPDGNAPANPPTGTGRSRTPSGTDASGPRNPNTPFPGSIPPPPPASARFPDTPPAPDPKTPRFPAQGSPSVSGAVPPRPGTQPSVPPRRTDAPAESASETTFRMRPVPTGPAAGDGRTGSASTPSATRGPSGGTVIPPVPDARPASGRPGADPHRPGAAARPGFPPRPTREASGAGATRTPSAPAGPPTTPPVPTSRPSTPPAPPRPSTPPAATESSAASLAPDPALSWSAPMPPHAGTPGNGRPVVSFGEPEVGYKERSWGVRIPPRIAAVAACAVLGLGLIGGAVTGSWLIGDSGDEGGGDRFTQAGELWHSVPVDQLFPPTVDGQGAGPGGADRTWTRIAVAPDSGCANAFDPLLRKALAPVGCERLLRATYTDATQSYVTTVGLLFTDADAGAMRDLDTRFTRDGLADRTDLMPLPYAAKNTLAADFGAAQRASWTISVLTDAPVVAFAVSGWADGRTVDTPESAEKAMESGDTTPAAQAGLGNEAQGLADRVERALRKTVTSPPEQSS